VGRVSGDPCCRRRERNRFNIRVAVQIDLDAVRSAVGPADLEAADQLITSGRLGEIHPVGGGAASIVRNDPGPLHEVWVGVTADGFTAECDCTEPEADGLCAHAVALTFAAVRDGFAWSSASTPPSAVKLDPKVRDLVEIAAKLPPRRLALLIAEQAATDRRLESRLLTYAGRLGPLADAELAAARKTLDSLAGEAMSGRWDLHDIANAGRWMVDELEVLGQRPPSDGALRVVEHAARLWDGLSVHLHDAWAVRDTDPEAIGDELRAIHVRMCEDVQPDPEELVERLTDIIGDADANSCLDAPDDYLAVVGPAGVDALARRHW
jgi:hypothetical protein